MPRKRGLSCHAPLLFYFHKSHHEKRANHTITSCTTLMPSHYLFCCFRITPCKKGQSYNPCQPLGVLLQMIIHPNLHESSHMLHYEKGNQHEFEGKSLETDITTWAEFSNGLKPPQNKH